MTDTAVYDTIANEYKQSKQLPFRKYIESHMIFDLIGDLRGLNVLDLACGEGIYSRRLKSLGAAAVTGVDLSAEMIALARTEEERAPLGVDYVVGDAAGYDGQGRFDLVLGSYLLNYARSWEELFSFCRSIFRSLKEGGRFVGFNDNPANPPDDYARYRKFGFYKTAPSLRHEGDPITYHFLKEDGGEFTFDNYYLSSETYENAFRETGFREFRWHDLRLAPQAAQVFAPGYWDEFLEHPPVIGLSARKTLLS